MSKTDAASLVAELAEALRQAQWVVHCGQFHQWKMMEQCTEKNCKAVMELLERVAEVTP